ncbi:MAG: ATP-binding protein [Actinomycetota bacterium]
MRERAERLLPAAVLLGFVIAAVAVSLLVRDAEERAVDGLEQAATNEVETVAAGMAQRFGGQLASTSSALFGFEFEATEGSAKDQEILDELNDLLGGLLQAGLYITDLDGVVTNGIEIDADLIGRPTGLPGMDDVLANEAFIGGRSFILPVGEGLTTDQPVQLNVVPILDGPVGEGRAYGALVLESPVSAENGFNEEVRALRRGETGTYTVIDSGGAVLAAGDPGLVAKPAPERVAGRPAGLEREDGELVIVAPIAEQLLGWTLVFTQDIDEFEEPLAGPLQTAGTILVIVLLGAGFVMTLVLIRRLRTAREEQERLTQISAAQQELISIVSHELRTPVAGVLGFLETSLDHWDQMDDAQRRSAVARAAANARRLQAMARDVLDTQNLEAGQLVQVMGPVELAAEVRDAVEAQQDLDAERRFEVELPDEHVWVSADSDRIQQVLANLLDNARKNAPVVAPIDVTLRLVDGQAEVTVRDQGPGITEEARERIFDKFVRGRSESVTGTGLGLYISRQIVEAHGGRIWAESDPGQGATFRFRIPLTATALTDREAEPATTTD